MTLPAAPAGFCSRRGAYAQEAIGAQRRGLFGDAFAVLGIDIVPEVVRLCAMNLYLHDIAGRDSPVEARDALLGDGGKTYDVVLTNPPFGKKQSDRIVRDDGEIDTEREDYDRQDFFVTTSNKQLNFLQHIMTVLAENGRAAVVMPDNVLFEGGAGETIRRRLLHNFRFPHPFAAADRHFLQTGCQSERAVLRKEAGFGRAPTLGICGSTICAPTSASR
jgi:type I restriction-modification system DNA methylase subunit